MLTPLSERDQAVPVNERGQTLPSGLKTNFRKDMTMAGRIVCENGLFVINYDDEVGYTVWNKLYQMVIDAPKMEAEAIRYVAECASNVLPEEPFQALFEEVEKCYPVWYRLFKDEIPTMVDESAFCSHVVQMAVVSNKNIRFYCDGGMVFMIKIHPEKANLMSFVSARNVSLYSASAENLTRWTKDMEINNAVS